MSWWQYQSVIQNNAMEVQNYYRLPPDACPYDGTPLDIGWITKPGQGKELQRHCPMGDYTWTGGQRLM